LRTAGRIGILMLVIYCCTYLTLSMLGDYRLGYRGRFTEPARVREYGYLLDVWHPALVDDRH
jgi:hypothetical protein